LTRQTWKKWRSRGDLRYADQRVLQGFFFGYISRVKLVLQASVRRRGPKMLTALIEELDRTLDHTFTSAFPYNHMPCRRSYSSSAFSAHI
jgi:hypothetical protein